ncbi:DUF2637 domain-containing protein [Streptomyces anulatus]|nr:DUF2637 domain-containing protein [Streptomyces anulatus]WSI79234.1 DUF2637 domain-containing protein [Streptomyces anulatus]GGY61156.1 hypothetical protein GCM10010342_56430 [Streptomyces anulatus]
MAFRVSWNALSDVARTIGADTTAALLYPIVVDGLMALALVATLVLTGADRKFALRVLATYTLASLLLNYVHGLMPTLHTESTRWGRLADWDPANWALVLLATSLPVGSIYFGSDLVAKVLHHNPESADSAEMASAQPAGRPAIESDGERADVHATDQPKSGPAQVPEPTPTKVVEGLVTGPTEADTSATSSRSRQSAAVSASTGASPRRAAGRGRATAKSTADRPRTDAEVLDEARLLTADWSDDRLTAMRLRSALEIGQKRARIVRDQLRAERTTNAEPVTYGGVEGEPLGGLDDADQQQEQHPATALSGAA